MAQLTAATDSYRQVGLREDLWDVITNISPMDTPFISNIGRVTAKARIHTWIKDSLSAATSNKHIEGDESAFVTAPIVGCALLLFLDKEEVAPASERPKSSWQRFRFIRHSAKRSECGQQQPQFNLWILTVGEKTRKEGSDMEDQKSGGKFIATTEKDVEFVFRSPNAKRVYLAGEFNAWEAESLPMKK